MTTPTPEQFLAQPADPDEDTEDQHASDPLESIAASLGLITSILVRHDNQEHEENHQREQADQLDHELGLLEEQKEEAWALIAEVLTICKPSTSKLANSIRAVLQPDTPVVEETVEEAIAEPAPKIGAGSMGHPAPAGDAPVEEWRGYARSLGYTGPDVDKANRSQIRTMLGISHGDD